MTALFRVLQLLRPRAAWLGAGLLLSLAALAAGVALMVGSASLVAGMVAGAVLVAPAGLRWLGIGRVALRYLERLVCHDAMFRALADLRVWFFRGLALRSAGGLGFRRAGDVLQRLVGDVEALDGLYLRIILPAAGALLLLPVLAWVIGRPDPGLGVLVVVLFVCAAFVLPVFAARQAAASGIRVATGGAALRVAALDTLTGLREVRAFGVEGRMLAAVQSREAALLAAQHAAATGAARANAAAFLCAQGAILAVLLAAGTRPTFAVAMLFVTVAAFEAVAGMPAPAPSLAIPPPPAARILDAADSPMPADPATTGLPTTAMPTASLPTGASLRFEAVHFTWDADRPPVFDGLSLDIPAHSRVALLGPSGAGKSTLAALALRVAAPQTGRILLGGVDIATLPAARVRSRIGWLGQTTHLFDDTIRANLLIARPDATDPELWAALDAARIGDFVRGLPDRLESWVGESGTRFSGGQGRRLALARTLLSQAPVLILDEPCAGLDAETERGFFEALNATPDDRTIILIAHRLTGIERLDRIWRLSAGRAVAAAG